MVAVQLRLATERSVLALTVVYTKFLPSLLNQIWALIRYSEKNLYLTRNHRKGKEDFQEPFYILRFC